VDFERARKVAAEKLGGPVSDAQLVSWLLYPSVTAELARHVQEYSDTAVVPTPSFFYGLEVGAETSFEIEPGKTFIVRLVQVGPLAKDGTREVWFELNGESRSVTVRDASAAKDDAARPKAEKGNPRQVGAPMPGKLVKLNVKPGDLVKAGDVLLVTEAMKMETNVKARESGTVAEVRCAEGQKVEKEDLLVVFA
jgi:pyruvate carboxylase